MSAADLDESVFLRACRGKPVEHPPVWFMRQAGRALPEYRAAREGVPMLQACMTPDLVAEVTLQPVRRYGVDAAIIFSDIVVPLKAIGVDLEIVAGVGPVLATPITTSRDVEQLRPLVATDVEFLDTAVRLVVAELGSTPLIGFAGAPFTLASYLVEGGPSREHLKTKSLMYSQPALWHDLLDRLASIAIEFLRVQVGAGARAVQLFDSWAGVLSPADYRRYVMPHSARVLAALGELQVPRIHFGVGTGELLGLMGEAGADVVGVDWRVPLDVAAARVGDRVLQGNLDPALVFAPWEVIADAASDVIARGRTARGHIFNLGHGVLPMTDPGVLTRLVEFVHQA
ncbi:MAG TPA: uroporphyrinogen decarboxylase [Acidothermaceae bacterium]|nr:uroporphyrinogen decarboxylase [Acidothermaceae bacterium]